MHGRRNIKLSRMLCSVVERAVPDVSSHVQGQGFDVGCFPSNACVLKMKRRELRAQRHGVTFPNAPQYRTVITISRDTHSPAALRTVKEPVALATGWAHSQSGCDVMQQKHLQVVKLADIPWFILHVVQAIPAAL